VATADTVPLTLDITQRLIDTGIKEDCGNCPIALAAKEAMPGAIGVRAGRKYITFFAQSRGTQFGILLPPTGQEFVQAFDAGSAEPCVFDVEIPSHLASLPGFLADESDLASIDTEACPL
jgi:hypothetical protein